MISKRILLGMLIVGGLVLLPMNTGLRVEGLG